MTKTIEHDSSLIQKLYDRLEYDKETGDFTWKMTLPLSRMSGKIAGTINNRGYRIINLGGHCFLAHRLAWLYVYGRWPNEQIDHIDRNPLNNKFSNLREATRIQNRQNTTAIKRNLCGVKGVSFRAKTNRWIASCCIKGKNFHIGVYNTLEEAKKAYQDFVKPFHGEFYYEN